MKYKARELKKPFSKNDGRTVWESDSAKLEQSYLNGKYKFTKKKR